MKQLLLSIILTSMVCADEAYAQAPTIQWQNCNGGNSEEYAFGVCLTTGSGYAVVGYTKSNNGSLANNHGSMDVLVERLGPTGNLMWQKCYGGSGNDYGRAIIPTDDGGYMVLAETWSNDGDVTGQHSVSGEADIWLLKLNDTGGVQWKKCYGGTHIEAATSMVATPDGGFVIAGQTNSNDGDVSGFHGTAGISGTDAWALKVNNTGAIVWQRCYGGTINEGWGSVTVADTGYILAGSTNSHDGDVSGGVHSLDTSDVWVAKINENGAIQWQKCYGGRQSEAANSVVKGGNGGYVIMGITNSNDGDVSGQHGMVGGFLSLNSDIWVVKIDNSGSVQWQKCLGGDLVDVGGCIIKSDLGGYVLTGSTESSNGDVTNQHGFSDMWLVRLDSMGNIVWKQCYGGSNADAGNCLIQTGTGYVVAGSTNSGDGDVGSAFPPNVYPDAWVMQLGGTTEVVCTAPAEITVYPNPATGMMHIRGADPANVRILNIAGQTVLEAEQTLEINLSQLTTGVYLMYIHEPTGGLLHYARIVKE
jgi:Secretion system C-terminal sorting domain